MKTAIKEHGTVLPGNILKVNSFLNHQIDPNLMYKIGKEFAQLFQTAKITKIITVESSGIAPAMMTGLALNVPVVFARKSKSLTVRDDVYTAEVISYTKKTNNQIYIEKKFINSDDHILIIDDFLANGEAVKGLLQIIKNANANLTGVGIVIEKSFQPGAQYLRDQGIIVHSLARIKSLANNKVTFMND
ncbi:xanthine phosphoribosyltransferase [Fructilactobacillus lindneri]|uniref:xanthine phosphoribosyltransferase n=1 Tax=Fructilactobacillus lindneri TaxID=53444 RepID=UPI000A9649FF|nr:xanthine phosphoribosyltransferase [Fructilactobacillus lindneri]